VEWGGAVLVERTPLLMLQGRQGSKNGKRKVPIKWGIEVERSGSRRRRGSIRERTESSKGAKRGAKKGAEQMWWVKGALRGAFNLRERPKNEKK